jgi:hypothetical protein
MPRDMTSYGPVKSSPVWTNDFLDRDHLIPGGAKVDSTAFFAADSVPVVVGAAGAAAGAVAVPVAALSGAIPSGTVLDFGAAKFAVLTAAAAAGAVTLTVRALPTALVSGDTARYAGIKPRALQGGTVIGRTIAERDASTPYGPAAAADDEVYIVAFDVSDITRINDVEIVRPNTVIKENFLPGFAALAAGVVTKLRDKYVCIRGSE